MKNLYEGGTGWDDQWVRRVWDFLCISLLVPSGVAPGPKYLHKYLPLFWEWVCPVLVESIVSPVVQQGGMKTVHLERSFCLQRQR